MKTTFSLGKRSALFPVLGAMCLSGFFVAAVLADDQVGTDAPHQERSSAANADKFRLPAGSAPVTVSVSSPTLIKAKSKKKRKKVEAVAVKSKEVPKATAVTKTEPVKATTSTAEQPQPSVPDDSVIGNDAPHQERSSDPDAHAGRLIIIAR